MILRFLAQDLLEHGRILRHRPKSRGGNCHSDRKIFVLKFLRNSPWSDNCHNEADGLRLDRLHELNKNQGTAQKGGSRDSTIGGTANPLNCLRPFPRKRGKDCERPKQLASLISRSQRRATNLAEKLGAQPETLYHPVMGNECSLYNSYFLQFIIVWRAHRHLLGDAKVYHTALRSKIG